MTRLTLLLLALCACTNESAARNTLDASGFTQIEITGHRWTSCADSDSTCTGFIARGPSGRIVTGAVGCGTWGKGCTIRIDP